MVFLERKRMADCLASFLSDEGFPAPASMVSSLGLLIEFIIIMLQVTSCIGREGGQGKKQVGADRGLKHQGRAACSQESRLSNLRVINSSFQHENRHKN